MRKLLVSLNEKRIVDLFITACEGGSNYWCNSLTPTGKGEDAYVAMLKGFSLIDGESGKTHTVSESDIEQALDLFAKNETRHFTNWLNEYDDAETGDVFLQLCVFKEVVYG